MGFHRYRLQQVDLIYAHIQIVCFLGSDACLRVTSFLTVRRLIVFARRKVLDVCRSV